MDIKGITVEEARGALSFMETVPVQSSGTIDQQCVMYANLSRFAAKLAAALSEAEGEAEEEDKDQ